MRSLLPIARDSTVGTPVGFESAVATPSFPLHRFRAVNTPMSVTPPDVRTIVAPES